MTDRDVVERAGQLLERAVVRLRRRRAHHKIPYATSIKGTPAVELMRAIRPFMSSARKARIDRAIASWHGGRRRWQDVQRRRPISFAPIEAPTSDVTAECVDECSTAWLAGVLEGEGAFTIMRCSAQIAYPVLRLEMCDQETVTRVARLLGAPSIQRRESRRDAWRATYVVGISGHAAAGWMRTLRPYMGARRAASIDAALAAYRPIRLIEAPAKCVVPRCDRPHRARGLCHKHYMTWSRDRAKGKAPRVRPLR